MTMKIVFLPLIFYATLTSVAGLDLGPIIRIGQCQSVCLQTYGMVGGICENDCQQCWYSCKTLEDWKKEERHKACEQRNFHDVIMLPDFPLKSSDGYRDLIKNPLPSTYQCLGCETACIFFQTKGEDKEIYDASKLPAPENSEIHMSDYDVAIVMRRDINGKWQENGHHSAKRQPKLEPLGWIILINEKDGIKHYSWEKWLPDLDTIIISNALNQACITWYDWRDQLKEQRHKLNDNIVELQFLDKSDELTRPSFVVTWQQDTGYGIMGNQVTNSESAQISLSPGNNYLVRVASSEGPGSYPIIVRADYWNKVELSIFGEPMNISQYFLLLRVLNVTLGIMITLITTLFIDGIKMILKRRRKSAKQKLMWKMIDNALEKGYQVEIRSWTIKSEGAKNEIVKKSWMKDLETHIRNCVIVDIIDECELKKKNQEHQSTVINMMSDENDEMKDVNANINDEMKDANANIK